MVLVTVLMLGQVHPARTEVVKDILQPGDIIFVDIYTGWHHAGYWDHLAIYIGTGLGVLRYPVPAVVEATFDGGVYCTPLDEFLRRDEPASTAVIRLKEWPSHAEAIRQAVEYAIAQVGKPFDHTATAGIPMKLNEANIHCTELIWRAFKAAGIDLDGNGGLLLYPDDIYYSPKLEPIRR